MITKLTFLTVVLTTLFMTGVIWFVQIVHYPLFAKIGSSQFTQYESQHTMRTGWVVAPIMLLELGSTIWLLLQRPGYISLVEAIVLVALTVGVWLSTFFWQVPLHSMLLKSFDVGAIEKLVSSNWLRTVFWTLKSLLCCVIVGRFIP